MAYLMRDAKGKDILSGMMQGRQARRQLAHMSQSKQAQLQQSDRPRPTPKKSVSQRRFRLPFFNRDAA
ncbi:MAG: hypothetical protein JO247_11270 [Chloroflexi bacterium]|nr:hypothetical protein [Chloroflexota bacterium]